MEEKLKKKRKRQKSKKEEKRLNKEKHINEKRAVHWFAVCFQRKNEKKNNDENAMENTSVLSGGFRV